jgi:secreted Zn-dependent insulinase-like peptidase
VLFLIVATPSFASQLQQDVVKSPNDKREYAYTTLGNGLEVMFISDPDTDSAAASLDIQVGSSSDPEQYPGLAHFLEHMLFLGTAKYPEPDEYQKFISDHGGSHNAYTSLENTNYFFDIQADFLEGALDRFSQQFTAPLFNEEYVEREVNAVHSEFSSKIKDDGRRYLSSFKTTLSPNHPYKKFSVGNLETLKSSDNKSLREALLDFYGTQYSANRMKLVILGKEPLETLAKWVQDRFTDIPNKNLPITNIDTPFFPGGFLPATLQVKSVMDKRSMTLAFPIPSPTPYLKSQPMSYLANLIGHEGKGSLLSALKNKELVDTLSAGTQFDTRSKALFMISMSLTEKGLKQQNEILETVFAYIKLLDNEGIQKLYFDEQAKLSKINFEFSEKAPPISYARAIASSLHEHKAKDILMAGYDLSDYKPELYKEYLSLLTPDNLLISISSQSVFTDQESEWFNAPFSVKPLSISIVQSLKKVGVLDELKLPEPNRFIPDNINLVKAENDTIPRKLDSVNGVELWHATDTSFGTPKATLFLSIRSPKAVDSVEHQALTQLMVSLLNDNLVEYSYPAYLAGLSYDLYKHIRGISIKISGYEDKQTELLSAILDSVQTSEFKQERFSIIKERMKRSLENEKERKPFQQAISKTQDLLITPSWSVDEKLAALESIKLEDLKAFRTVFLSTIDTAILSNGNIEAPESQALAKLVEDKLLKKAKIAHVDKASIINLSGDHGWVAPISVSHPDTSFVFYLQGENKSYAEHAKFSVLAQAISNDYYALLRTEKQLGYIVFASPFSMLDVPGIAFIVQSPTSNSQAIYQETNSFLQAQTETLENLDDASFERYKQAVIARLEEKDTNLFQRSSRYWSEIDRENAQFNTKEALIQSISELAIPTFLEFYGQLLSNSGNSLLVFSEGNATKAASKEVQYQELRKANHKNLEHLDLFQ